MSHKQFLVGIVIQAYNKQQGGCDKRYCKLYFTIIYTMENWVYYTECPNNKTKNIEVNIYERWSKRVGLVITMSHKI